MKTTTVTTSNLTKQEILSRIDFKAFYSSELSSIKWNGAGMGQGLCPFHEDHKPSLSVNLNTGQFKCFGCDKKGSIFDFCMAKHGVNFRTALEELSKMAGLTPEKKLKIITLKEIRELVLAGGYRFDRIHTYKKGHPEYIKGIYKNNAGDNKGQFFTLIDKEKSLYTWGRKSKAVLYHEELLEGKPGDPVFLSESERDCDNLAVLGFLAVSSGGAQSWKDEFSSRLQGREIIILPHNDEAGSIFAQKVTQSLRQKAKSIKILDSILFGNFKGADISDWLGNGGTKEGLLRIIENTPEWEEPKKRELIDSLPTLSDLACLDLRVEYLLYELIPQNSITVLYGKGGRGKSTLMIQIGYCISEGIPFEGIVTKKATVVYVDYDNPLNVIAQKARQFGEAKNFYYWHITNPNKPSRIDRDGWEEFKRLPQNSLLIFDTLKSCQGMDMDKDNTMAFVMGRFRELRDEGFTIVVLHHTNRAGLIKNNTTITDNADHVLALKPLKVKEAKNPDEPTGEEEPEYATDLFFGCGRDDKSRYPKNHICLTFDGQIFERIPDPETENYEKVRKTIIELAEKGNLPNQTKIVDEVNKQLRFNRLKTIEILNRGEGRYWKSTRIKEQRNQKVYEPVVKLSDYIYSSTTEQLPEKSVSVVKNNSPQETVQPTDNAELSSCQDTFPITETTGVIDIDLEHEEVEITE